MLILYMILILNAIEINRKQAIQNKDIERLCEIKLFLYQGTDRSRTPHCIYPLWSTIGNEIRNGITRTLEDTVAGSKNYGISTSRNTIQTYYETSLHASIKKWYALPGDLIETLVDGYRIDIVRQDLLIEIQIKDFFRLKDKLKILLNNHRVLVVHPISSQKWIKHTDTNKRRLSPRKGIMDHIFQELVYITPQLNNPNLSLEILFVHEEEIRKNDGRGSWRRKGISIVDRKLLSVIERLSFDFPAICQQILETFENRHFTSKDIALQRKIPEHLARKMIYCFNKTDLITKIGRRGHHNLYTVVM